jgi:2-haloacid dehalogenase/putative hydrolase of the HAD superfamily
VEPCLKPRSRDLGQPRKEQLEAGQKKPTAEVKTLLEAARLLGAAT